MSAAKPLEDRIAHVGKVLRKAIPVGDFFMDFLQIRVNKPK